MGLVIQYLKNIIMGGVRKGIDGYPYLEHIIELWPRYPGDNLGTKNEAVGEWNKCEKEVGKKWFVICFSKDKFSEFIGCIILEVHYVEKVFRIWVKTHNSDHGNMKVKTQREVHRNIKVVKVSCHIYCFK